MTDSLCRKRNLADSFTPCVDKVQKIFESVILGPEVMNLINLMVSSLSAHPSKYEQK